MKKTLFSFIPTVILIFIILYIIEYFSIDRTGKLMMDGIVFKGEEYQIIDFAFTKEGKTIGKADSWDIKEIPEDKEHNFLAVRSFLDNFYVVKSSYVIPEEGEIAVVYIDHNRYTDKEPILAVESILNEEIIDKFNIKMDNIFHYTKRVYIGYEDCPCGTKYIGLVGKINGKMVYIRPTKGEYEESGVSKKQIYCCYCIPEQYQKVFEIFPYYIEDTVEIII